MRRSAGLLVRGLAMVVVAIVIAVRGGADDATPGSAEIVLEDLRFKPIQLNARVGVPLTVRPTNRGTERHALDFPSLNMPGLQGVESILEPGETRTIWLRFAPPGTHTFICSLPGHAASGMTGAVYVRP